MKIAQAATPIRVGGNKQIVSVPNHNYQVKIRKVFRLLADPFIGPGTASLTILGLLDAVRNELGYGSGAPAVNTGEIVALHDIRVYSTVPYQPGTSVTPAGNTLIVSLFDIEESSTSRVNRTCLFEDVSSNAGISHVRAVYPVQNRPTFTGLTTPTLVLAEYTTRPLNLVVIDADITYVRTPSATN